jgi:hypothetical protein
MKWISWFLAHAPWVLAGLTVIALAPFVLSGCGEEGANPIVENGFGLQDSTFDHDSEGLAKRTWDPSGWQNAILRETKYALSTRMNGTSRCIYYYGGGYYYVGDWDYVNSNQTVLNAVNSACGLPSGSYGLWVEYNNGQCLLVGHGGWCKFFANLIQWRATGGAKGCLPPNTDASGSVDWVEPADIIQIPQYYGHTAVVIGILERFPDGRVKTVDVIDSNFIGGDGEWIIARHPITRPALNSYRTYH